MSTARAIVDDALTICGAVGIGQSASGILSDFALRRLNGLVSSFCADPLWVPKRQQVTGTLVSAQGTYTVGDAADIDTPRPEALTAVAIDQWGQYVPLQWIAPDDWDNRTRELSTSSVPCAFTYRPTHPNGILEIFPTPQQGFTVYLTPQTEGVNYGFNTDSGYSTAYEEALTYSLAANLGEAMGRDVTMVKATADKLVARLKRNNDNSRTLVNELAVI